MNRVCLIGRLTAKPELKYNTSNIPYTRFTLAVNRTYSNAQGEKQSDFINCIVWRKSAENMAKYLDKGSRVSVEGRIQTGSYTAQDGKKRYTTDVVADSVQFLESKKQIAETSRVGTPADYKQEPEDPFADFGKEVVANEEVPVDDNFLD